MSNLELSSLVDEFAKELKAQLKEDEKRWGDTWRRVPVEGQEVRIAERLQRYFSDFNNYRLAIPWLKVAGYGFIAWVKENHPELLIKPESQGEDKKIDSA